MKKKISFDYDEEAGLTIATLKTSKGTFYGTSCKHPDDKFHSSYSIGTQIAEARANINLCNKLIANKKLEQKGLKRLLAAMPEDNPGFRYVVHLIDAIQNEIYDIIGEKKTWKKTINSAIDARGMYIRSRSTDKKEKDKYLQTLGQAIHDLGIINKAKDKED